MTTDSHHPFPFRAGDSAKRTRSLAKWLEQSGAEVLEPTNEWELLRFQNGGVTSILYTTKTGKLTFTGEMHYAWDACFHGGSWRPSVRKTRVRRASAKRRRLRQRDGGACFYCGRTIPEEEETLEHLIPVAHGGTNHLSNSALAHSQCNTKAAALSLPQKLELRDRLRPKSALVKRGRQRRQDVETVSLVMRAVKGTNRGV